MALLSTNDYSPKDVASKLVTSRNLHTGRSKVVTVTAIDLREATAVATLRVIFGFKEAKAALIFQGVDPHSFCEDPQLHIPRCAFCGLDLRDAFDLVDITLSPPFNQESHHRQAHAACINEAFGDSSTVEFFQGTSFVPDDAEPRVPGNGSADEFRQVLGRIVDSEQLDFTGATRVEIAVINVGPSGIVVLIDADYRLSDLELADILGHD